MKDPSGLRSTCGRNIRPPGETRHLLRKFGYLTTLGFAAKSTDTDLLCARGRNDRHDNGETDGCDIRTSDNRSPNIHGPLSNVLDKSRVQKCGDSGCFVLQRCRPMRSEAEGLDMWRSVELVIALLSWCHRLVKRMFGYPPTACIEYNSPHNSHRLRKRRCVRQPASSRWPVH